MGLFLWINWARSNGDSQHTREERNQEKALWVMTPIFAKATLLLYAELAP